MSNESRNTVTLDFIVEAADKKFANLTIDLPSGPVVLVNAMQLPKAKRDELLGSQKRLSKAKEEAEAALESGEDVEEVEADQVEQLQETLRIVVKGGEENADRLIEALDGNLARLATVFELYTNGTELGEASASAS